MTSVYIDDNARITAYNPNDLRGNTGWELVPETINDPITEEHGVPIYKHQNGHAVSRTAEEIAADIPAPEKPEPTDFDRLEAQAMYTALMTDTLLED